jgi:hypothetical protein
MLLDNKEREERVMCRFDKKREMCVCPKCGGDDTRMEDYEMDIDCLWTKWYCPDCEASWNEYYTLIYDGYHQDGVVYDAEGKECTDI